MKSKALFCIIGISIIVLILLFALKLCQVTTDQFGRIVIWYLAGKDDDGDFYLRMLDIRSKHSLAKFSKIKMDMRSTEILELVGKPTSTGPTCYRYKIDKGWNFSLSNGELYIVDDHNNRNFKLEYYEYSAPLSYLRYAGSLTNNGDDKPKHSLAKFSKVKIGMNLAEVAKLAGKPTDSVDSSFIWYRYKIDTGWYIDLHFFNEQLSDISIVDYPNNRVFELQQDEYITTLPCPNAVAQTGGNNGTGTFIDDRDGKAYRTVKIGTLTWMAENLNFVMDSSVCHDNDESNCQKYGRLYNWDAAMTACPAGWRLSSDEDWVNLALAAAGKCNGRVHWKIAGLKLKSTEWESHSGNGTDDVGFSALPGGFRFGPFSRSLVGDFSSIGSYFGSWWSARESDESDTTRAGGWYMSSGMSFGMTSDNKWAMRSVRCVRE